MKLWHESRYLLERINGGDVGEIFIRDGEGGQEGPPPRAGAGVGQGEDLFEGDGMAVVCTAEGVEGCVGEVDVLGSEALLVWGCR